MGGRATDTTPGAIIPHCGQHLLELCRGQTDPAVLTWEPLSTSWAEKVSQERWHIRNFKKMNGGFLRKEIGEGLYSQTFSGNSEVLWLENRLYASEW